MIRNIKKSFVIISIIVMHSGCNYRPDNTVSDQSFHNQQHKPDITIWIHGTMFISKQFWPTLFYYTDGLRKASELEQCYYTRLAHIVCAENSDRFDFDNFYLFGWSGLLSFQEREKAGKMLLTELNQIIAEYIAYYGHRPYIRIITHSHGGNVALNMAHFAQYSELSIDELILLACPVQHSTKQYINHPIFKKIYSLYSLIDFIQILDPQGLYNKLNNEQKQLLSERVFPDSDNLIQAQLWYGFRGIMHIEYILPYFFHALPAILDKLDILSQSQQDRHHHTVINIKELTNTKEKFRCDEKTDGNKFYWIY